MQGDQNRPDTAGQTKTSPAERPAGASLPNASDGDIEDITDEVDGMTNSPPPSFDDTITGEIAALIDDGRNYAQAELAFQKVRAKIAGRNIAVAIICGVVAIVLLHIAFLALAVGLVIALAPLVTIWGAIGIVVGALICLVVLLGLKAKSSSTRIAALFASAKDEGE